MPTPKSLAHVLLYPLLGLILPGAAFFLAAKESAAMALTLISPDFSAGGAIPAVHTCQGKNISPALDWSGLPAGTRSLVLIVDDPDAPDPAAPRMTWVH